MERTGEEKMSTAGWMCGISQHTSPTRKRGNDAPTLARRASVLRGPLFLSLLAVLVVAAPARAQQADDDDDPPQAPVVAQPMFADEDFDQWIFQNRGNFSGARQRLDVLLTLQVEDIDRACKLTDAQKKKLLLTGRGDIKRFFNLYEKAKQKFQLVKNDPQKHQEIWQEIAPLQIMMQSGLFNDDSFLFKALHNTITNEQLQIYQALARDRQAFRHRANIELAVMMIEMNAPLRAEQRRALITLLTNLTKPPRKSGPYGYYITLYQMSQLPEEKLKPLFDEAQWQAARVQMNGFRGIKQWLKQSGQLPDEDDNVKADARPPAGKK
jgi:hypothetical protein